MLAPIVAEIYGPDDAGRLKVASEVRSAFGRAPGVVDVDASYIADAPRQVLSVDRPKAARLGVSDADIVTTLRAGIAGEDATRIFRMPPNFRHRCACNCPTVPTVAWMQP